MSNLFDPVPPRLPEELVEVLVETDDLRLERIVSAGHATPPGQWYDQPRPEWVVVLRGCARLRLEGPDETVTLEAGDCLTIPAHRRHRVEWTDPARPTIWLALHHGRSGPASRQ